MFSTPFGIAMMIIIGSYIAYYTFYLVKDIFFDKSGEVVQEATTEEHEMDIADELEDFARFNANDDEMSTERQGGVEENAYSEPAAEDVPDVGVSSNIDAEITSNTETDSDTDEHNILAQEEEYHAPSKDIEEETDIEKENEEDRDEFRNLFSLERVAKMLGLLPEHPFMEGGIEADDFANFFPFDNVAYAYSKIG